MKKANIINDMFTAAVTEKVKHPGYKVITERRELGPYTRKIALEVAKELHAESLMDMSTGEIIDII